MRMLECSRTVVSQRTLFHLHEQAFLQEVRGAPVQENAIMQTCVGSVAGLAFTGGFGSYLIAMDEQSYENVGNVPGNSAWVRVPQQHAQPSYLAFLEGSLLLTAFRGVPDCPTRLPQ